MAGNTSAFASDQNLDRLSEAIDAIRTVELWIGLDCEVLHRTGDEPRKAVRALRTYCDSKEARDWRHWLAANGRPHDADALFCALEGLARTLQEMRNVVIDLENADVQAVDYPDEDFWIGTFSIEAGWERIRDQAESIRHLLDGLAERLPSVQGG